AAAAPTLDARPPSATGWASKVRDPIRSLQGPETTSALATTATGPDAPRAPAIAQVFTGRGPVVAPPADAVPALQVLSGGTTARLDAGHDGEKPPAPTEARTAETKTKAAGEARQREAEAGGKVAGDKLAGLAVAAQMVPRWSWPPIVAKLL